MGLFCYLLLTGIVLLCVASVSGQVDVTSLTCNSDKSIDLTVSNAEGYYVSILGCAEEQQISGGTASLTTCSLSWGTMYTVQVYVNTGVFTSSDYSEGVMCVRDTSDITAMAYPTISNIATDATVTDLVKPTVTMSITTDSAGTTPATTVAVGTALYLNIDLGGDYITSDGFDIRAKTITVASGGTTVTLTGASADGDGCLSQTYWSSTSDLGQGSLQITFNAFMIVTGTSYLDSQVYTATIEVCLGTTCAAYTCGSARKKRSAISTEILENIKAQKELVVIGLPLNGDTYNGSHVNSQGTNDLCVTKGTFYGISIFFIVSLILSVAATCFMFFRIRALRMRKGSA